MKRSKNGARIPRGPRARHGATPRVLILSNDSSLMSWLKTELRTLLRDLWFVAYPSIDEFRRAEGDIIHDIVVYCSKHYERPDTVKEIMGKILFICPEAKIVLYSAADEDPQNDHRVAAVVEQPHESELADAIRRILRPEAA
jgi:hypothetical protein